VSQNVFQKALHRARESAEIVADSLTASIPITALPRNSRIPFKALALRELLFHRASALASPAVALLEAGNSVSGMLLTRALMETVSVLVELFSALESFLENRDDEKLNHFLMGATFANRLEKDGVKDDFYTVSILKYVDKLDKEVNGFRKTYDALSEYCHPNWHGLQGSFGVIDSDREVLELGPKAEDEGLAISATALAVTLEILIDYYDEMPQLFIALCQHFDPEWKEGTAA
jgi:hypothetical protein